jgi:hypothetical protein
MAQCKREMFHMKQDKYRVAINCDLLRYFHGPSKGAGKGLADEEKMNFIDVGLGECYEMMMDVGRKIKLEDTYM